MIATEKAKHLRLIAYGRVSTASQMDGYGPDVQTKGMRKWARVNGHTIVDALFDGGVSGTVDGEERPELSKALAMVAGGEVDGILAPNMDRLARELTVQEGTLTVIWAHGGRFFTVDQGEVRMDDDDDPTRKFIRQVLGAAAELERGLIVKRLKSGRAAKKAAGKYAGGAPAYGQEVVNGTLTAQTDEAVALERVKSLRAEGASYRAIATLLNTEGVPTKRGGRWQATTVARILNPTARGSDAERATARRARTKVETKLRKAAKITGRVA